MAVMAARALYTLFAVLSVFPAVITLLMFAAIGDITHPLALLFSGALFGITGLYVLAAVLVPVQPRLWSIFVAVVQTLGVVILLRDGFDAADLVSIVSAAVCWGLVVAIFRRPAPFKES
jgi:hypothetical protein